MGLLSRTGEIIRAKFNALLNRAENPSETLDYSYEKQLTSLQNVKRGVADVVTAKKRLELQTQQLEQNVVKLDTQARQAVAAGREDLARQALERKSAIQQQLQDLDAQVKQLEDQQQKLVDSQKQLEARVEQFRSQKEVIKAQYSAAEAQVRIGEAATGIGRDMDNTGLAIQRAKDKTEQMQARASAIDDAARPRALAARIAAAGRQGARAAQDRGRLGYREERARDLSSERRLVGDLGRYHRTPAEQVDAGACGHQARGRREQSVVDDGHEGCAYCDRDGLRRADQRLRRAGDTALQSRRRA
jgi:phage shock protein A